MYQFPYAFLNFDTRNSKIHCVKIQNSKFNLNFKFQLNCNAKITIKNHDELWSIVMKYNENKQLCGQLQCCNYYDLTLWFIVIFKKSSQLLLLL